MRIIDITETLNEEIAIYKGDPRFYMEAHSTVRDNGYAIHRIKMGTHTGTHIDAPSHFFEKQATVKDIPLHRLFGECEVVEDVFDFKGGTSRLLLKKNEPLTMESAQIIIDARVRLVGTSNQSIGGDEVHRFLISHDCIIIESLKMDTVSPGRYTFCGMPLKIDADGSPMRACLIECMED